MNRLKFLFCLGLIIILSACTNQYEELRYEIPVPNESDLGLILSRTGYTVSFNTESNIPNWVAWELNASKLLELESRKSHFITDPDINPIIAITTNDYKGSGWDRGHMCPAADNKWDRDAMNESFYMTNVCPQNHNLNRGDWKELEEACRKWAEDEPIYIACGPILYDEPIYGYVGTVHKVRIPDAFFKVIMTGLESNMPRAIGFIYKNSSSNRKLYYYVNSVDEVERITGYDFFSALPDDIEDAIEEVYDLESWE